MKPPFAVLAALFAGMLTAAPAAAFDDPDWPCQQRRVNNLSMGAMWTGPVPEDPEAWREDPALADAVARIAARRTPMHEVEAIIDQIAEGPDPAERLPMLYAGVFSLIDAERARIVDGIVRYVQRQRGLAEQIDAEQVELARLEAETAQDDFDGQDRIEEMRDKILWDVRIYEERRRSLMFVCESPVILEQRAFAVARAVMARLEAN
ncbi:MAG: hypothetical protein ACK4WC_16350 [Rubrimonas sp.]